MFGLVGPDGAGKTTVMRLLHLSWNQLPALHGLPGNIQYKRCRID
ncbi:hypothetical protein [Candidatus Kuenenia stuttgartensis]